jgi:hypothetical protein
MQDNMIALRAPNVPLRASSQRKRTGYNVFGAVNK